MEEIQSINGSPKRFISFILDIEHVLISFFLIERLTNVEEWSWYEKYIVNYFLHDLGLLGRFTPAQIHRAIGLINVNAVALKFPMNSKGKTLRRHVFEPKYFMTSQIKLDSMTSFYL